MYDTHLSVYSQQPQQMQRPQKTFVAACETYTPMHPSTYILNACGSQISKRANESQASKKCKIGNALQAASR